MNELKLLLHNFQSISDGELIFKTGLNFIIGQSNSGKSATFRALKACLSNPSGSQRFIKRGHNQAEVVLLYNGNEIIWDRTQKESSYIINGEEFVKTGNSDSFKILNDNTGFTRDTNDVIMNIEEELQVPFPFGISKSDLFKLYENVFCVSDSAVILKSAKEHEDEIKTELSSLELELTKNKSKLEAIRKFKEAVDVQRLKDYKVYLIEKGNRFNFLNDGMDIIKTAIKVSESNIAIREEEYSNLIPSYYEALEIKKALTIAKKCHVISKSFQELNNFRVNKLDEKLNELEGLQKLFKRTEKLGELFTPEVSFSSKIASYSSLVELKSTFEKLQEIDRIKVSEKEFLNKLSNYQELKNFKETLNKIKEQGKSLSERRKQIEKELVTIENKLKEFKVCPLCHHELE